MNKIKFVYLVDYKIYAFSFLLIFISNTAKSQDASFSQFYLYSLYENPAIAGSANDPRLFLHYRNDWPYFGQTFITYQASFDQYIKKMHGGVGLNILRDNMGNGALSSTDIDLLYSYRTKITHTFTVQYGLQASFLFKSLNMGALSAGSGTSSISSTSSITPQPDFSMGVVGFDRNIQIGFSVHHLNPGLVRFNYSFVQSPLKFAVFIAKNIKIYDKYKVKDNGFILTPAVMVQKQGASIMLNYGAGATFNKVFAGLWMRNNLPFQLTATIFSLGYAFNNIRLGYSYDFEWLSLKNVMPVTGAHEITLISTFPVDPKRNRYGPIKCPDINTE